MSKKKKKTIPYGGHTPKCPHFELCGGCTYQKFDYEGQKALKLAQVRELMSGVCEDFPLEECISSPREWGYRNKMEFSFGDDEKDGPLTLGLHQRGSFFNIVPILDCQIVDADFRAILWVTLQYFRELGVPYVHKKTHEGFLRHLLVRKSVATGEILVALVTSSDTLVECKTTNDEADTDLEGAEACVGESEKDIQGVNDNEEKKTYFIENRTSEELVQGFSDKILSLMLDGDIKGILHMKNDSLADVVQADETVLLYGEDFIEERLLGLSFKITPFSFFQTNSTGAEVLYSIVRDYIGDTTGLTVYDLYSGTGTIAQMLAPVAKRVVGVEIVEEAVEAAKENAVRNGLANCEFIAGDVLTVLDSLTEPPDVMVLDPPREGIHPKALPKLLSYGVEHFVYVSCNPKALARDMDAILAAGYRPIKAKCVDMFPWTMHIELCTLFIKN